MSVIPQYLHDSGSGPKAGWYLEGYVFAKDSNPVNIWLGPFDTDIEAIEGFDRYKHAVLHLREEPV